MITDGNRSVLIRTVPNPFGQEDVAWDLVEELENLQVIDSPASDILDEASPVSGKPMVR